jgi:uncharacterized protein
MNRIQQLEERIAALDSCVVAFSGGVDSSLVAALAASALRDRALAVTAVSPALATGELDGARNVARVVGIAHLTRTTTELAREGYVRNGRDRCYHCKTELYDRLAVLAAQRGYGALLSGANADDLGDWRPGLRAAAEHRVIHPLMEAGVKKDEVRELARRLKIPSADKPASPCLASRLPYGAPVKIDTLRRVDRAERALKALGYRVLRVRDYGPVGRVELGGDELARALTPQRHKEILAALHKAGYPSVEIDPKPFHSGSLNSSAGVKRLGKAR